MAAALRHRPFPGLRSSASQAAAPRQSEHGAGPATTLASPLSKTRPGELLMRNLTALAALMLAAATSASAQPYPDKPIKLIVPLVAGSPIVTIGRVVTTPLSSRLG